LWWSRWGRQIPDTGVWKTAWVRGVSNFVSNPGRHRSRRSFVSTPSVRNIFSFVGKFRPRRVFGVKRVTVRRGPPQTEPARQACEWILLNVVESQLFPRSGRPCFVCQRGERRPQKTRCCVFALCWFLCRPAKPWGVETHRANPAKANPPSSASKSRGQREAYLAMTSFDGLPTLYKYEILAGLDFECLS